MNGKPEEGRSPRKRRRRREKIRGNSPAKRTQKHKTTKRPRRGRRKNVPLFLSDTDRLLLEENPNKEWRGNRQLESEQPIAQQINYLTIETGFGLSLSELLVARATIPPASPAAPSHPPRRPPAG